MNGPRNGAQQLLDNLKKPQPMKQVSMPKVAICVPSGDTVHKGFAMALAALTYTSAQQGDAPGIPLALVGTEGSLIVRNRNEAIAQAQKLGVDYALFLDTDVIFPYYTLRRLLDHGKDIVGATYVQREEPHRLLGIWPDGTLLTSDRIHEVNALPGGCILIKMSVFDKMTRPYYRTPAFEADGDVEPHIQGEDYYFCEQAQEAGVAVWLDVSLSMRLQHIGRKLNTIAVQQQTPPAPLDPNQLVEADDGQAAVQ